MMVGVWSEIRRLLQKAFVEVLLISENYLTLFCKAQTAEEYILFWLNVYKTSEVKLQCLIWN